MNKEKNKNLAELGEGNCCILGGVDGYLASGKEAIDKLTEVINEKKYRVKSSGMTSRVINYLEKEGLLDCDREKTSSWRKFSFKELIYLRVINALRQYGFKNEQLASVKESFFGSLLGDDANMAIHYVLNRRAIYLIVDSTGLTTFFDDIGMELLVRKKKKSYINININELYNDIRKCAGQDTVAYKNMSDILGEVISDFDLDEREIEVMKIIRDKKYKKITVRKTKKQEYVVSAENIKENQKDEILKMIENGDYFDMNIKKRDGKVISIRKEDAFKI